MVEEAVNKWGLVDVFVNNAGRTKFCTQTDLEGLQKKDFLEIYSKNLEGSYQMIRAVTPHMKKIGDGAVVNISSTSALTSMGNSNVYACSKATLINLKICLTRVLGPEIRTPFVPASFKVSGFKKIWARNITT